MRADCAEARRRLARFALDDLNTIAAAKVERPAGLHDRGWNNWRPLLALAAAAGPSWLGVARQAAITIAAAGDDGDGEDVATLALQHVWEVLEPAGRLATADILWHLVAKDEGPWSKWWESSMAKDELRSPSAKLARLLRPFGVRPRQLWIEERNTRGYDAGDFRAPACAPYLEKVARDAKDARPQEPRHAGSSVFSGPSAFSGVRDGRIPIPGDDGFLDHILGAFRAGHLTTGEALEREALHKALLDAAAEDEDEITFADLQETVLAKQRETGEYGQPLAAMTAGAKRRKRAGPEPNIDALLDDIPF